MSLLDFLKKETPSVSLNSTVVKTTDSFKIATNAISKKGFNTHGLMDYEWEIGEIKSSLFGTELTSAATASFADGFSATSMIGTTAINVSGLVEGEWVTVPLKCTVKNEMIFGGPLVEDYTETASDEAYITVAYTDSSGLIIDRQTKKRMHIVNGQIKPQRILNNTFASHYADNYNDVDKSDYAEGIEQRLLSLSAYTENNKALTNVPVVTTQDESDGWVSIASSGGLLYKGKREDNGSLTIVDRHGENAIGKISYHDIWRLKKKIATHSSGASTVDNYYPIDFSSKEIATEQIEDQSFDMLPFVNHASGEIEKAFTASRQQKHLDTVKTLMYGMASNHAAGSVYNGYTLDEFTVVNLDLGKTEKTMALGALSSKAAFAPLIEQLEEWASMTPTKVTQLENFYSKSTEKFSFNYSLSPPEKKFMTLGPEGKGLLSLESVFFNQSEVNTEYTITTSTYKYKINAVKKNVDNQKGKKSWQRDIQSDMTKGQSTIMKDSRDVQTIYVGLGLPFMESFIRKGVLDTRLGSNLTPEDITVNAGVPVGGTLLDGKLHGNLDWGFKIEIDFRF